MHLYMLESPRAKSEDKLRPDEEGMFKPGKVRPPEGAAESVVLVTSIAVLLGELSRDIEAAPNTLA